MAARQYGTTEFASQLRTYICILLLAGLAPSKATDASAPYSLHGRLESFTVIYGKTNLHSEAEFDFARSNSEWWLRVRYVHLPGKGPKYREFAGDGTDIFEVVSWGRELVQKNAPGVDNPNTEIAHVSRGVMPSSATPVDYAAWIALAGNYYFQPLPGHGFMPCLFHDLSTNRVSYQVILSDVAPRVVSNLKIYRPGVRFLPSQQLVDRSAASLGPLVYPPPYDQGFIGAEYRVVGWTNLNGLLHPTDFRLDYFNLRKQPATGLYEPKLTDSVIGTVTSISNAAIASPLRPSITTNMTIIDQRLRGSAGTAVYDSSVQGWLDSRDPQFASTVKKMGNRVRSGSPSGGAVRMVVIAVFGTSVLVLLAVMLRVNRKPRSTKQA